MTLTLHLHPFSSYCQKVLIALYEAGTPFVPQLVNLGDPDAAEAFRALWPLGQFPVLVDDARGATVPESSIIIEYLDMHHPGAAPMLPEDAELRLRVRMLDRIFDNHVMTPMQAIVAQHIRPEAERDPLAIEQARGRLGRAYGWLEGELAGRRWAAGEAFTLADCAAAPALFYADLLAPVDGQPALAAYLARLRARPSFARAVDEARPYRGFFPPGWPEGKD
jgi:glutathione S-transferase